MYGSLALIIDAVLFALVALGYAKALRKTHATMKSCPDTLSTSHGDDSRRWFQLILLLANTARTASVIVELWMSGTGACPNAWGCTAARAAPQLLFVTAFSRLVLYFSQLTHGVEGQPYPLVKPLFFFSNVAMYAVFLVPVILGASGAVGSARAFDAAVFSMLAIAYTSTLVGLLYYGGRLASSLRPSAVSVSSSPYVGGRRAGSTARREWHILPLVLRVCGLLGLILALSALYCIVAALGAFGWQDGHPPQMSLFAFDAGLYVLLELLPSLAVLLVTRRRKPPAGDGNERRSSNGALDASWPAAIGGGSAESLPLLNVEARRQQRMYTIATSPPPRPAAPDAAQQRDKMYPRQHSPRPQRGPAIHADMA